MNKKKTKRSFSHLTDEKRDRIQIHWERGEKQCDIAKVLKVDISTISREISRRSKKDGAYDSEKAHQKYKAKRTHSKYKGMKLEGMPETREYVKSELRRGRSPDEIAGRMKRDGREKRVGKDAIYNWIYSVWGQAYCKYLCTKRKKIKKQKKKVKRFKIPDRRPLSERPGHGVHAEADMFLSPRKAKTRVGGGLVVLPKYKLLFGERMPDSTGKSMERFLENAVEAISFDTLTLDNGSENAGHLKFPVSSYFCDPYSPWQKPHVENNIGLLRRWRFPKGTNFSKVSDEEMTEAVHFLNSKYRKSLGYANAYEAASADGIIKES